MELNASLAARAYGAMQSTTKPEAAKLEQTLGRAGDEFAEVLQRGEKTAKASMVGDADPHALVDALARTELAVETAVAVRDKVVEAYQEILRMPV